VRPEFGPFHGATLHLKIDEARLFLITFELKKRKHEHLRRLEIPAEAAMKFSVITPMDGRLRVPALARFLTLSVIVCLPLVHIVIGVGAS
jgi:hypothetical protein